MTFHIRPIGLSISALTPWVWLSVGSLGRFGVSLGRHSGLTAYLHVGQNRFLSFRLGCDWDEQIIWEIAPFCLTRPETEEEQRDREEAEAEAAFLDREANRYTQWSH